jgi:hypothetical protein
MSELDEIAADIVGRVPDPPRPVPTWLLVRRLYRTSGARWVAGLGLILGVPTTVAALAAAGLLWQRIALAGLLGAFTIFIIFAPAIGAIRLARSLRTGMTIEGEILTVRWSAPSLRPATVEAGRNGMAVGKRRVFHPAGTFEERFESDSRWARELVAGTRVRVLADPSRPRVQFDLGPIPR